MQVAGALLVIGATPPIMPVVGQSIEAAVGHLVWWVMPAMSLVLLVFVLCFPVVMKELDSQRRQTSGRDQAGHSQVFGLELRGRR